MKVVLFGPSFRFASGISYYTVRLANALTDAGHDVSVVLFRELLPRAIFPGSARVGAPISDLKFGAKVRVFDGLDWQWLMSLPGALSFMSEQKPDVVILPWWSSTVAHSELMVALVNRLRGNAKLIVEFHETLDPLEAKRPWLRLYASVMRSLLFRNANAFVAHSQAERTLILREFEISPAHVFLVPHGTYDQFLGSSPATKPASEDCTFLFFGLLRPYKGVEYLLRAFESLPEDEAARSRLVIAGETWEGYEEPSRLIGMSKYRSRIDFHNRYLMDSEIKTIFERADVAVLPYLRASQSGAAHIAMAKGMPIVASDVGGLAEACREYDGAILVPPGDIGALQQAMIKARSLVGQRFADPFPWTRTTADYEEIFRFVTESQAQELGRHNR